MRIGSTTSDFSGETMFGTKKVRVNALLWGGAKTAATNAGYASVREFVEHAIEKHIEAVGGDQAAEREQVEDRLRGLGYIS